MVAIMFAANTNAQTELFSENFDDGGAEDRWTIIEDAYYVNSFQADFDYVSDLGAAPNGGGLGLKMEVNIEDNGTGSAYEAYVQALPTGESFSGEYTLTFDMYLSYTYGGTGTTEYSLTGVGHDNSSIPAAAPLVDGYDLAMTGDNGSSSDIKVYMDGSSTDVGVKFGDPAGSQNQDADYYWNAMGDTMPGNQWLQMKIDVTADSVTYYVNDFMWAQIAAANVSGNISLGYLDYFSGSIADAVSFVVFDNVLVEGPSANKVEDAFVSDVSVYPNPATDVLTIKTEGLSTVNLINAIGQVVKTKTVDRIDEINVSELNSGIYVVRLTNETGDIATKKILIK